MTLDSDLVKVLQCPDCRGNIKYKKKSEKLSCTKCKRVFKIANSIPIMLPKEK